MENNIPVQKDNKKGLIIIIVILSLLVVGFSGYFVYEKFIVDSNLEKDSEKEQEKDKTDDSLKEIGISERIVLESMDNFKSIHLQENAVYKNNRFNIDLISKYDLIGTALNLMDESKINYCVTEIDNDDPSISISEFNNGLKKVILNPQTITIDDIKNTSNEVSYPAAKYEIANHGFNIINNNIQVIGPCDGEFSGKDYINKKLVKAEKNDKYLYVYEKQAFAKYNFDISTGDNFMVDYYKDFNKTGNKLETLVSSEFSIVDSPIPNSEPNWSLYDTYKYIFKIENGNYYFESIELIK